MNQLVKIVFALFCFCGAMTTLDAKPPEAPNTSHPGADVLRQFLRHISKEEFEQAYVLVSGSAKTVEDSTIKDGPVTRDEFRAELAADRTKLEPLVAEVEALREDRERELKNWPNPMDDDHPRARLWALRTRIARIEKCRNFQLGDPKIIAENKVEIPVTTRIEGSLVDNDLAILVLESGHWLLANPIHIIR